MPYEKFGITYYTTEEASKLIGRHKRTLLTWIYAGQIKDVGRNKIKHREWLEEDIKRFQEFANEKAMIIERGHS